MEFNQKPILNAQTLAIVPRFVDEKRAGAVVMEAAEEYVTNDLPKQVIDKGCLYYGSSLKGRIEGTRAIFGVNRKAPIVVDPVSGLFFLPTSSPSSPECVWVSHKHIDRLERIDTKKTRIYFQGGKELTVNVSYHSLTNQVLRTAQFKHVLMERITKPHDSDYAAFDKRHA